MNEVDIIGKTLCPWCNDELEIIKSSKSGYHYANCTSCNSHFRNIPVVLVEMKGKQKTQPESENPRDILNRFLEKRRQEERLQSNSKESALERLRRQEYA